jgi:hypothetical protein
LKVPDFARPASQVPEFGKVPRSSGAIAPAAVYFVMSVLPTSITSGALPAPSVASNFVL